MSTSGLLISVGTIAAIWALFALGLNLKFGYSGLLDFGHVAFFLVGAYTTALLVLPPPEIQRLQTYLFGLDLPGWFSEALGFELAGVLGWAVALLVGAIVAGIFGLFVALPAIRLREDYLAIALLGISVIAKRTVQTESWLANGPDALRGYDQPLIGLFPLPGESGESLVLFALVVFVVWSVAIQLLSRRSFLDASASEAISDGGADRAWMPSFGRRAASERIFRGVFAVFLLGIGYVAARRARRARRRGTGSAVPWIVGGAAIPAVAVLVLVPAGFRLDALVLTLGTVSLFTWAYAALLVFDHFDAVAARDALVALGLAVAFVVTFAPVATAGGVDGGPLSTGGIVPTLVLLAAFVAGAYYLLTNWDRYSRGTTAVSLLGVVGVWLFVFRYFGLPTSRQIATDDVGGAIGVLVENLLFLLTYRGSGIGGGVAFGYSRFLFIVVLGVLALSYLLLETTVTSPFGRVLKAIREDEDVAMALGKNTFAYKVQSMVLGSAIAGLAGGLAAIYYGTLTFRNFDPLYTFFMFLIVVIGGTANNRGVILGAALYWAFVQASNDIASAFPTGEATIASLRVAFLGALFIAILYYRSEGIWGEERTVSEVEG